MRSWNLRDRTKSGRLSKLLVAAIAAPLMVVLVAGCGPSRPDPLAVVKDGGDDEEEERPRPQAAQKPAVAQPGAGGRPGAPGDGAAVVGAQPAAVPSGVAPFDLSFLPVDTELVLVAQCGDIIRSALVQTVTAGDLSALDPFVEGFGLRFLGIHSLRVGIRNLEELPAPTKERLAQGMDSLSLRDIALNPDISSTIVIQTRDRVDETPLRKMGDEIRVGDKRYFRLKSNTFQSACACIHGFRTLIISDEPTILSIVESDGPPPKPKANFSFAREADLVVAISPEKQELMQQWLPPLSLLTAQAAEDSEPGQADAPDAPESAGNAPLEATDEANVPIDSTSAPTATDNKTPEQTAAANGDPAVGDRAIPKHVTGAALMVNLQQGVAISVSLNCDSLAAAESAEAELQGLAAQVQAAAESTDSLSGGVRDLVDSLSATRLQTVAALTSAVAPDRQADVMSLPAVVLGGGRAPGDGTAATVTSAAAGEPAGAFAERILVEGVPPLASQTPLPGMELRGLARWQPSLTGIEGPRQLELGVVAFGGPATTAVAAGHFQLDEAEVNRLSPLKWLGTSPGYDAAGLSPIDGLVPVSHEIESSVHPRNGVLAVFTVVPPSEPATHLRRFRGKFVMRYYTISEEILVENLREAIRTKTVPEELKAAGVEFDLSRLAGNETFELFYPDSTSLGAVKLLAANGDPIEQVESASTSSQGQVLRTLTSGGVLPEDVVLSVTLNSELAELDVPFEFANLPIPNVGTLTDMQRALLVWTEAEADSGLPDGLVVEAQARWDNPDGATGLLASAPESQPSNRPQRSFIVKSDDDDDDERRTPGRPRAGQMSERPLRVLVDLTGPLIEEADALGEAHITSIETDFRSGLNFEGALFCQQDATGDPVRTSRSSRRSRSGPPGGMRVAFHFTPPPDPIHELVRLNGSVRLRISQNQSESMVSDLRERTGRRLVTRELASLGVALVVRVEDDRILVRLLEGKDEQISELIAVDTFGDPIPGVVTSFEDAANRAEGRRVHTLSFSNGVPAGVGLRVTANSSVRTVDVPFRFTKLPVPPSPGLPGL